MIKFFPPDFMSTFSCSSLEEIKRCFVHQKYRALLIFSSKELIKEAALNAYAQGNSVTTADPTLKPNISQWFDIEDEANAPIIQSQIQLAMAEVNHTVSAIGTGRNLGNVSIDAHMHPVKEHSIEVWVSSETTDSIVYSLSTFINQYIVNSILTKWASLTNPTAVEYWTAQRDSQLEALRLASLHLQPKRISVRKFPAW